MAIILVNGMYKTGSTFLYTVLRKYYEHSKEGEVGLYFSELNANNYEFSYRNIIKMMDLEGDYVIKIHFYELSILQRVLQATGATHIFIDRDQDQILESYYHHFSNERVKLPFSLFCLTIGLFKSFECEVYRNAAKRLECESFKAHSFVKDQVFSNPLETVLSIIDEDNDDLPQPLQTVIENSKVGSGNDVYNITGMSDRPWFTSREPVVRSKYQLFILKATSRFPKMLLKIRPVRFIAYRLFCNYRGFYKDFYRNY